MLWTMKEICSKFLGFRTEIKVLPYVKKISVKVRKEGVGFHNSTNMECDGMCPFSGSQASVFERWLGHLFSKFNPKRSLLFTNLHNQIS